MTNENNEVNETATPAVDTSVDNKNTESVTTAQETTPVENVAKEVNKTETTSVSEVSAKSKDGLPKGVKTRLWEQAERIRKLEAELEKSKVAPVNITNASTAPAVNDTEVNLLDDPNKWASSVEDKIIQQAETNILAKLKQAEAEKKITIEANEAKDYILSQPEMSSEESIGEMQSIIATPEVQALCSVSPKKGAEYALDLWKKAKGIDTASVAKANVNASQSASISPSGVSAEKKVFQQSEIAKYLDYKHPDYDKRRAEVHLAIAEGRIR